MALAACLAFLSASCADEQANQPGQITQSSTGRFPEPSVRLVSLSPLATRFVIEIGARHHLVGIDEKSHSLLDLDDVPVVNLGNLGDFTPTLVLVPEIPTDDTAMRDLRPDGIRMVEFAPQDMEDVYALCREVGVELVGAVAAALYERRIGVPLARVGGQSPSAGRPRVVAVVGFDPLVLASGHSFETDLIETAGGSSISHEFHEMILEISPDLLRELAPDLVLVTAGHPATENEIARAQAALPDGLRIAFFDFDRESYWLREPVKDAERLRSLFLSLGLEKQPH